MSEQRREDEGMDLPDFLLARIAEDEAVGQEAVPSTTRWSVGLERTPDRRGVVAHLVVPDDSVDGAGIASDEVARTRWLTSALHVARWDPARVLAECEAKRQIVTLYQRAEARVETETRRVMAGGYPDERGRVGGWDVSALRPVLQLLALPYADHQDYDPAWRP